MKMNLSFFTLLFLFGNVLNAQSLRSVLDKMYIAIGTTNLMSYDMTSSERIGAKMVTKNMSFKVQISPRKVYMKDKDSGVELLYVSGWNNNMPYIIPNTVFINISLEVDTMISVMPIVIRLLCNANCNMPAYCNKPVVICML
jgi:hypothetical protein